MGKYYNQLNSEVKEYFKILSPNYPEWLEEYIDTKEMQRIGKISMSCGTDYSNCFHIRYWYSNLDHSVGVALIIWHFTHDKKQTLAGLFHDIATPVFKHCIDYMNGDGEHQESTEERTVDMIRNSEDIMRLLKRDNITLEEISDYKIYPIADNDSPRLSADRFEYTFSSGLTFHRVWELEDIKEIYQNICIVKNEDELEELAFKDKKTARKYIRIISKLWPEWVSDKDRTVMQFLADMCKSLKNIQQLSIDDLYTLSEQEVIQKFENCNDDYLRKAWKSFCECNKVFQSETNKKDKYCINVKSKVRYINPLVIQNRKVVRVYDCSKQAKQHIDNYLKIPKGGYYTYFDFDFKPYE